MLLEEFGDDFVLELDFGFQSLDLLVLGVVDLRLSPGLCKGRIGVVEELFLPGLNLCWL